MEVTPRHVIWPVFSRTLGPPAIPSPAGGPGVLTIVESFGNDPDFDSVQKASPADCHLEALAR